LHRATLQVTVVHRIAFAVVFRHEVINQPCKENPKEPELDLGSGNF
jgi:hypothetical protein